jgi:hypothetical protein
MFGFPAFIVWISVIFVWITGFFVCVSSIFKILGRQSKQKLFFFCLDFRDFCLDFQFALLGYAWGEKNCPQDHQDPQ